MQLIYVRVLVLKCARWIFQMVEKRILSTGEHSSIEIFRFEGLSSATSGCEIFMQSHVITYPWFEF